MLMPCLDLVMALHTSQVPGQALSCGRQCCINPDPSAWVPTHLTPDPSVLPHPTVDPCVPPPSHP